MPTLFNNELILVHFKHSPPILAIQIYLFINAHPCPTLTPTVFQTVFAIVDEFDFCMLLAEVR